MSLEPNHGVSEINPIPSKNYHDGFRDAPFVDWTTPGLKITRLRMVSDPGFPFWDITYCHGRLNNENVIVNLPFSELPKRNREQTILKHARRDKVFAKGLGIFDAISSLN